MSDAFPPSLASLLHEEGGFVNNQHDPGGITNLGVTIAAWRQWTHGPVTIDDMKALTPDKVAPFYRALYWQAASCDQLPGALALCVFHAAVNSGPGVAARLVQRVVGADLDGHIGPGTLKAVQAYVTAHGLADLVRKYQDDRRAFYRSLPTFPTFGKGWLARTDRVETAALKLI